MSANKSSAVADQDPIDVLFAVHNKFCLLDFAGALQVFSSAVHNPQDPESKLLLSCVR